MHELTRYIAISMLGLGMWTALSSSVAAAEALMRLRGTEQTFTGEMLGFDGKSYYVQTHLFGKVYFDAEKYECVSGACPQAETGTAEDDTAPTPKSDSVRVSPAKSRPSTDMTREERNRLFQQFLDWRRSKRN